MRISISDCRKAIAITRWNGSITAGIPLTIHGEKMLITKVATEGTRSKPSSRWVSGDMCFTRNEQELLTKLARVIIIADKNRFPVLPPKISIRDCQEAIEIASGIPLTIRGEKMLITKVATEGTRSKPSSRWVSGDLRFTCKEQELLTKLARAIIANKASQ